MACVMIRSAFFRRMASRLKPIDSNSQGVNQENGLINWKNSQRSGGIRLEVTRSMSNRRSLTLKPANPKVRVALIAGSAFAATAVGSAVYENWRKERERSKLILRQLSQANNPQIFSSPVQEAVDMEKVKAVPVSQHFPGLAKIPEGLTLTLFQYRTCPFCCKVRAFLNYHGIPYNLIEVNPVLRQQIKFSKYKKVPILVISKERKQPKDERQTESQAEEEEDKWALQLNDSSLIISALATYFLCNPEHKETLDSIMEMYQNITSISVEDNKSVSEVVNKYFLMLGDNLTADEYKKRVNLLSEERKWREWADNTLVHTLSPNIYRSINESLDSFRYFSEVGQWERLFSTWERLLVIYAGATAMYFVGNRLKKKYLLKGDVRESLYDNCRQWLKAVGKKRKFMGGDKPNLADLGVFGVLSSIEGCDAFNDCLKNTNIGPWYFAVKESCIKQGGHQFV